MESRISDTTTVYQFSSGNTILNIVNNFYILDENGPIRYNNKRFKLLEEITIDDGIGEMKPFAFYSCNSLKSVVIDQACDLTEIGLCAFEDCKELKTVSLPSSIRYIDDMAFYNCTKLESVTLEEGLEIIYHKAFNTCRSLTKIVIPSTVNYLGAWAFNNCPNLTDIEYKGAKAKLQQAFKTEPSMTFDSGVTIKCSDGDYVVE